MYKTKLLIARYVCIKLIFRNGFLFLTFYISLCKDSITPYCKIGFLSKRSRLSLDDVCLQEILHEVCFGIDRINFDNLVCKIDRHIFAYRIALANV